MKHYATQSILLEVSQRELEMIRFATYITSSYLDKQADDCLERATGAEYGYRTLAKDYEELHKNAKQLLEELPF